MAYIKPSDPRYKKMTPAQRNANTLLNVKNSFKSAPKATAKPTAKNTTTATKGKTSIDKDGNKVVIDSNGKTVTSKDKSSIAYYNKRGKTLIKNDYDEKSTVKSVYNKNGNFTTYKDKDGISKTISNKKGETWILPKASTFNNGKGYSVKRKDGSKAYESYKKGIRYEKDASGKVTASNLKTYDTINLNQAKKTTTPTPAPAAKTVSQVWKEKTGKDWSEAKKLGLSDGSASSNMALLKKLNSGKITNADLNPSKFKEVTATLPTKKVSEIEKPATELETMRRGGIKGKKPALKKKVVVKKPVMKRGGKKK